tara:strand:+ start:127 stop:600 length:474 start_codon:yes stop_codon:yes gene_type:complete
MKTFDEIIDKVLEHEGGYVNDPKDLGGETKYGITKRFYPNLDIKNLTKEEAKEIYKRDYWDKNRIDEIPNQLKYIFFDMCVNMGRGTAVKVLQRAAVSKGQKISIDGGLGPLTLKAIQKVGVERVRSYRVLYYAQLVTKRKDQEKFWFGWFRRALEV